MFENISKRDFWIILAALLFGIAITVEITYYAAQWYIVAQHSYDPLAKTGGLAQAIEKK